MKTLRAKLVDMRTMASLALAFVMFAVMAANQEAKVMASGWSGFKSSLVDFFYNGLGGDGAKAIGIAIVCIGIVCAVVSFILHKMNPQTRFPGWIMCLLIAFIGSLLFAGVGPVISIVTNIRDTVMGWAGFSGFGDIPN